MEEVMSMYKPEKARNKGIVGSIEGTVTVVIAGLMLGAAKSIMGDNVPPEAQAWISNSAGAISGALVLGAFRWWNNRRKHKL